MVNRAVLNIKTAETDDNRQQNVASSELSKPFPKQALDFTCLQYKSFKNTVGKGEIAPFPTVFSTRMENFLPFSSSSKLSAAKSFSLEVSKICRLEKV